MNTHIISETSDQRVEILLPVHEYLRSFSPISFVPNDWTLSLLLSIINKELTSKGYRKKQEIQYSSQVPIVQQGFMLSLMQPFDVFETGLNWIASQNTLQQSEKYDDILNEIGQLYSTEPLDGKIYTAIFHKPINDIKGYCAYIKETIIYVLMWGYEEINLGEIDF